MPLDLEKVGFIGHGLGAMVGLGYLAAETKPTPSSLMNVGGGLAQLFNSSAKLNVLIQPQFAKLGIPTRRDAYQQYLQQAQLVGIRLTSFSISWAGGEATPFTID